MTQVTLLLRAELPKGVTPNQFRDYVREAVEIWCKQLEPPCEHNDYQGDPLFDFNRNTLTIRFVKPDKPSPTTVLGLPV